MATGGKASAAGLRHARGDCFVREPDATSPALRQADPPHSARTRGRVCDALRHPRADRRSPSVSHSARKTTRSECARAVGLRTSTSPKCSSSSSLCTLKLNVPELFLGAAVRYWTFSVMGLALIGIGLAEYFERRRADVLAVPLRRTGVLLPLIPLLAFWAKPPEFLTEFANGRAPGLSPMLAYLEKLPQHFDTYAWLWFLAGGVYGLVALSRKSFGWALLAALATNGAPWSLLTYHELPFFVHPQAWVIPLALILLGSEHVNRRRLREDVSNGMRYLGVAMIYVASAADMFIAGVGQSVWLPVILAVLCVAGRAGGNHDAGAGIPVPRIGFLFLDIFAMIWHAPVNLEQTWVWYASGIVLGVAILALFAVFEKWKNQTEG